MPRHAPTRPWRATLTALAVGVGAFVGVVAAAYLADTGGEPRTLRRLQVDGIPAGNLGQGDLAGVLGQRRETVEGMDVRIDMPDGTRVIPAGELGISIDEGDALDRALAAGRTGDAVERFRAWLGSFTTSSHVSTSLVFDPELATPRVAGLDGLMVSQPTEPRLVLSPEQAMTIRPGVPGSRVDEEAIVTRLGHQVAAGGPFDVDAPTKPVPPATSDEELANLAATLNAVTAGGVMVEVGDEARLLPESALRNRLDTTPGPGASAPAFDLDSLQLLIERTFGDLAVGGSDPVFDIVDDEPVLVEEGVAPLECCADTAAARVAAAVLEDRPGTVAVDPRPNEDLRVLAWADGSQIVEQVSEFTTPHSCCEARVGNIQRFADIVRGVYLTPGESLSLNGFVGERTTERGFVPAGTIIRGHLVPTVGGGVSQFATTMFNAAFFAGFDFETYQSHSLYISRYPYGREATISWPAPDLEVVNTTDYPALIWTSYDGTSITVSVYSTRSVEVEQTRQENSAVRECTRVDTFRLRTYDDGREVEDSVFATYRPDEGLDCDGNPTEPPEEL